MRIPKLNNRSRACVLGLGIFMVALSTAAEYAVSVEQEDSWEVTHTAALDHSVKNPESRACRDAVQEQALARLQSL